MFVRSIEKFFLNTILGISIIGVLLILVSNLIWYPEDILSISLSGIILVACLVSFGLRMKHPIASVLLITTIVLGAISYQRLTTPTTYSSLAVVMIVGFTYSVMFRGTLMLVMHAIVFVIINTVFVLNLSDAITAAVTYSTLYFVLTYATATLKGSYDRIQMILEERNRTLKEVQKELKDMNKNLEHEVNQRTVKIKEQNARLIKYSYTNAHHLRGPVARLLGLAYIYKIDAQGDHDFFVSKMVDQATEIDSVVRQINKELDEGLD